MTEVSRSSSLLRDKRFWGGVAGLVAFGVIGFGPEVEGLTPTARRAAGVTALMSCFWMAEVLPIYVTALFPLVLFPALGVADPKKASAPYADQVVFLMLGGFMLAEAISRWGLHRRIALYSILLTGRSRSGTVLGFMIATGFLSMWMSNSATAMLMVPIGASVLVRAGVEDSNGRRDPMGAALMLGIAYAASIGGIATLVGTPPNAIFQGQAAKLFPQAPPVFFDQWMWFGLPTAVVMMVLAWLVLTRVVYRLGGGGPLLDRATIREELAKLGPMSRGERTVTVVFALTAAAWMSRTLWAEWLPKGVSIDDSTVAMAAALALFLIPVDLGKREFALNWRSAVKLPWGVLLLFGGGFSLASGLTASGTMDWVGVRLSGFSEVSPLVMTAVVAVLIIFLTEVTSNTAVATVMMPVMASAAVAMNLHPYLLMLPMTLASSLGFMLPSGTPPNAIVFGTGHVSLPEMARAGVILNLIAAVLVTVASLYLAPWAFGMDFSVIPAWAKP